MIASRLGVIILAALAVALAIVHLAIGSGAAVENHAPFADLVAAPPTALAWDRTGAPAIALARNGDAWTMTAPSPGPIDPAAIDDVLSALRGAREQRTADHAPGPASLTLRVGTDVLAIGPDVPDVGGWITRRGRAYLVDSWVVHALDRDALSLRVRAPFAAALDGLARIEVRGDKVDTVLIGRFLALSTPAGPIRLRADVATAVVDHLAAVHVERLPTAPLAQTASVRISLRGNADADLDVRGPCPDDPDLVAIAGAASGNACVAAEPLIALDAAVQAIAAQPIANADPHLITSVPHAMKLLSGVELRWRGASASIDGGAGADDDAVERIVAAVSAETTPVALPSSPPKVTGTFEIDSSPYDLLGADLVVERGAGYAHRVGPDVIAALRLPDGELRDRLVWLTEPASLTALEVIDHGKDRAIATDDPWAKTLAEAVRELRVVRFASPPSPAVRRTIKLSYARPQANAEPEVHTIELGPRTKDGCFARIPSTDVHSLDRPDVVLAPDLCTLLEKPLPP